MTLWHCSYMQVTWGLLGNKKEAKSASDDNNHCWMRLSKIFWFVCGEQINYLSKRQTIDLRDTYTSRYFGITEFDNCFIIWSPSLFSYFKNHSLTAHGSDESVVAATHDQSILCSKTHSDGTMLEPTIICRQLFAGHVKGYGSMKQEKMMRRIMSCVLLRLSAGNGYQVSSQKRICCCNVSLHSLCECIMLYAQWEYLDTLTGWRPRPPGLKGSSNQASPEGLSVTFWHLGGFTCYGTQLACIAGVSEEGIQTRSLLLTPLSLFLPPSRPFYVSYRGYMQ